MMGSLNDGLRVTEHCFEGFHDRCETTRCDCSCHADLSPDELYTAANLYRSEFLAPRRGA